MTAPPTCARCSSPDLHMTDGLCAAGAGFLGFLVRDPLGPRDTDDPDDDWAMVFFDLRLCQGCGDVTLFASEERVPRPRVATSPTIGPDGRGRCRTCPGETISLPDTIEFAGAGPLLLCFAGRRAARLGASLCLACGLVAPSLGERGGADTAARVRHEYAHVPNRRCPACASSAVHFAPLGTEHAHDHVYVPLHGLEPGDNPVVVAAVCTDCTTVELAALPDDKAPWAPI
jgi:hypothetical protein